MTHPQKSPIAEASLLFPGGKMKLLRLGGKQSIFEVRVQDKQSISHKPTYLATASLKHCEIMPQVCGRPSRETNQSCCKNRVTPRTTRQPNWNHVDRGNLVHHTVTYHDGKGGSFNLNI